MFTWGGKNGSSSSSRGCLNGGKRDATTPPHPPSQQEDSNIKDVLPSLPRPPSQNYLLMVRNKKAMLYTISNREIRSHAATRIQSIVRQYLSRHIILKRVNHIYTTLLNRCALTIQKLVRTVYRKKRSRDRYHYETMRRVHALMIQSMVRGWLARIHFMDILHQKVKMLSIYYHVYIHLRICIYMCMYIYIYLRVFLYT